MTAKHIVKRMVQQDLHSVLIITVVVALHPANYHSISLARCIHLKVSTSMRLQQTSLHILLYDFLFCASYKIKTRTNIG